MYAIRSYYGDVPTVYAKSIGVAIDAYDVMRSDLYHDYYKAAPLGKPSIKAYSQNSKYEKLDMDKEHGCIRDIAHAYNKDGGLAVLFGNLAEEGCIVKTAGVDPSIYRNNFV